MKGIEYIVEIYVHKWKEHKISWKIGIIWSEHNIFLFIHVMNGQIFAWWTYFCMTHGRIQVFYWQKEYQNKFWNSELIEYVREFFDQEIVGRLTSGFCSFLVFSDLKVNVR